jgi:hypothetical protein
MRQTSKNKNTITRLELCELLGITLNTLSGRLLNHHYTQLIPERVNGSSSAFVYDKEKALEWIKEWNGEAKKASTVKLMKLNVKWGKPREIVQRLDKLKKEYYSQLNTD